jgi:hypothetical protein
MPRARLLALPSSQQLLIVPDCPQDGLSFWVQAQLSWLCSLTPLTPLEPSSILSSSPPHCLPTAQPGQTVLPVPWESANHSQGLPSPQSCKAPSRRPQVLQRTPTSSSLGGLSPCLQLSCRPFSPQPTFIPSSCLCWLLVGCFLGRFTSCVSPAPLSNANPGVPVRCFVNVIESPIS